MALHRNPADRFDANLRIVTRAGITPPPEIASLRQRLDDFRQQAFSTGALDQAVNAIVHGTGTDTAMLWAAACAESTITDAAKNEVLNTVRLRVNTAIRAAYAPEAIPNYLTVATKFDRAAQEFTAAAAVCDPTESAAAVVAASEKIRKAWQATATHADELSKLLPVLRAAAELAGLCGSDPDDAIDLAVDPNGLDRDTVLAAWTTDEREALEAKQADNGLPFTRPAPTHTRGGRWTALHQAGAVIRALPVNEPALT